MHLIKWFGRITIVALLIGAWPGLANLRYNDDTPDRRWTQHIEQTWVDSVYATLTLEERVGQLMMIRAHSDKGPDYEDLVAGYIDSFKVGGICFFQGTALKQAELTNRYQAASKTPLLVAMDAEWGLGMRLKGEDIVNFPYQVTLGALRDDSLIYDMGREIARQLTRIGVHMNFAPVADINNNPANPVINFRSFGEDRDRVSQKSIAYMQGLQDGGVMACAKHFPGHGDTEVDSHEELPVITHDRARLDSLELYPFRKLIKAGVQGVMVGHLQISALDSNPDLPSTLSYLTIHQLLREEMQFKGLIITDAMEMKGVANHYPAGEAELMALQAGNDIILLPADLPRAVQRILTAYQEGTLTESTLSNATKRILLAKYRLGLWHQTPLKIDRLSQDLNQPISEIIRAKIAAHAITLVRNKDGLIPFKSPVMGKVASINLGGGLNNPFQATLRKYMNMPLHYAGTKLSKREMNHWVDQLKAYEVVIVGMFDLNPRVSSGYGVARQSLEFLEELSNLTNVVVVHFGNPYALKFYDELDWVIQANQEDILTQVRAAEGIMGHYIVQGKLPVTASAKAKSGDGFFGDNLFRLGYGSPVEVGMNLDTLAKIDDLILEMLAEKATPGGQILVVKNRKVVYEKAFGRQTYDADSPEVDMETIYDLASITKVAATTLAVMKLEEEGEIDLLQRLDLYLPAAERTRGGRLRLKDMLTHSAGQKSWIPFYQKTMDKNKPSPAYYQKKPLMGYQIPVAANMWLNNSHPAEMIEVILRDRGHKQKTYLYSDLGFILLWQMIEAQAGIPLDQFMEENFYASLGLTTLGFNPHKRFPLYQIAPTEIDSYFRMQTIRGYVHDMTTAMFGGVSGHAGLFSNAHDLAILFQMLLNGGYYGGQQYLKPETIRKFTTRCSNCNRRGLGFDMKNLKGTSEHISVYASDRTFGHMGFTGTCVWADPVHDLIYIFISNRTYPDMENKALQNGNYRQRIQDVIYQSLNTTLIL
jgi:beta-glucosidase-like glycosyl hydrolase/CubicO group peptidase (beta-lactamase class C family)